MFQPTNLASLSLARLVHSDCAFYLPPLLVTLGNVPISIHRPPIRLNPPAGVEPPLILPTQKLRVTFCGRRARDCVVLDLTRVFRPTGSSNLKSGSKPAIYLKAVPGVSLATPHIWIDRSMPAVSGVIYWENSSYQVLHTKHQ